MDYEPIGDSGVTSSPSKVRQVVGWVVFAILQVLFIPLALLGIGIAGYKAVWVSKKKGLSKTATDVLTNRWLMHAFGLREDRGAAALMKILPNVSRTGWWLIVFPTWVHSRITGRSLFPKVAPRGEETVWELISNRTIYFDELLAAAPQQLVILGAGLDTRAHSQLRHGRTMYELDRGAMQITKRAALARTGIDDSHVKYVPTDFETDDWAENLLQAGYDASKAAVFLWEGVTPYLTSGAVRGTMARVLALNGTLVMDVYSPLFTTGATNRAVKAAVSVNNATDEGFKFSLNMAQGAAKVLDTFARDHGFRCNRSYPMGETKYGEAYVAVVELVPIPNWV